MHAFKVGFCPVRWAALSGRALVLAAIAIHANAAARAGASSGACDRICLAHTVDQYLAALAAREPGRLNWARNARFSENNVLLPVGAGLWRTASAPAKAVLKFEDPQSAQAGALALIEQRGRPAFFAMRLEVRDGEITEVETQINEPAAGAQPSPAAGDPRAYFHYPQMSTELPVAERTPRLRMVDLVYGYFSTLQLNDGVLLTAFDPECRRQENGFETTANPKFKRPEGKLYCGAQFKTGTFRFDTAVRDRDFLVIDELHGLVLARGFIDHDAAAAEYALADGTRVPNPITKPESISLLELFHITRGRIDRIEAVHIPVPYGMPSVWRSSCR